MMFRSSRRTGVLAGIAAVALLVSAGACGSGTQAAEEPQDPQKDGPIAVASSTVMWGSLAAQIGGDDVSVTTLSQDAKATKTGSGTAGKSSKDNGDADGFEILVANGAGYDAWAARTAGDVDTTVSAAQTVGAMEGDNPYLWLSKDARAGVAQELVNAFSKARPSLKKTFRANYRQWLKTEDALEEAMAGFAKDHKDGTYAATGDVAYYLMSDMGLADATPEGYALAMSDDAPVEADDYRAFDELLGTAGTDLLVTDPQSAEAAKDITIDEATDGDDADGTQSSDANADGDADADAGDGTKNGDDADTSKNDDADADDDAAVVPDDPAATLVAAARHADVPVLAVAETMPDDAGTLTDWIASIVDEAIELTLPYCDDDATDAGTDADGTDAGDASADSAGSSDGDASGTAKESATDGTDGADGVTDDGDDEDDEDAAVPTCRPRPSSSDDANGTDTANSGKSAQ
ncbi:metal ABC transporter solute-binding protein, Zn/Mn family [Bifidobacterium samirii]|uniref:ABC transporter substrate-binding protein n=1 Tax=Bifidobacterium samirii TaxID=2306974 RepID=A0A430FUH6_9BIFI|nr:zinc ABC transporter substrate-binding protein [Bifidobacterium samirii]RSX56961.1 ABC transporter substrate-binding protein [Bifidobacterium samirii]